MTEESKDRLKSSGTDQGTVPDVVTSVLQPLELHWSPVWKLHFSSYTSGDHQLTAAGRVRRPEIQQLFCGWNFEQFRWLWGWFKNTDQLQWYQLQHCSI